jgi:hypothetical protein
MFENLLMATGSKFYPWSGPGSKKLVQGTRAVGYFGEVSQTELFDGRLPFSMLTIPYGFINYRVDNVWLKFMVDGRVYYTPKYPLANGMRWNDLYATGAVFGVRGPGPTPVPATGPVDQINLMLKREKVAGKTKIWPLKLQLFSGADTVVDISTSYPTDNSPYDRFWKPFFANKWESYTWLDMNSGRSYVYTLIQERSSAGDLAGVRGGGNYVIKGSINPASGASDMTWRPVFELITDPGFALDVIEVSGNPVGGLVPLIPSFADEGVPVQKVTGVVGYNSYLLPPEVSFTPIEAQIFAVVPGAIQNGVMTLDNVDTALTTVKAVQGYSSRLRTPQSTVMKVIPEAWASTPDAIVTLSARLSNTGVTLKPVKRVDGVRTRLLPGDLVTPVNVIPTVGATTQQQQSLPNVTFTYEEPQDLAATFPNTALDGFVI